MNRARLACVTVIVAGLAGAVPVFLASCGSGSKPGALGGGGGVQNDAAPIDSTTLDSAMSQDRRSGIKQGGLSRATLRKPPRSFPRTPRRAPPQTGAQHRVGQLTGNEPR